MKRRDAIGFHIDFAYCTDDLFNVIELIVHPSGEVKFGRIWIPRWSRLFTGNPIGN